MRWQRWPGGEQAGWMQKNGQRYGYYGYLSCNLIRYLQTRLPLFTSSFYYLLLLLLLLPILLLLILLLLFLPSQQGGWGVLNDRLLEDPPGTFDGVPGYVITRIEEVLLNTTAACHVLFTDIIRLTIEY